MTTPTVLDTHDMVLVHRVFRRELGLLPGLVRAASGDTAQAERVRAHAEELMGFLHHHHSGEDELVWPRLRERVVVERELVDRMEGQHEAVAALVAQIEVALPGWGGDRHRGEALADLLGRLREALVEHLDEEEREILPLAAVHIAPEEWAQLGEHGMSRIEKSQLPILFGSVLEEATPAERTMMLRVVPPPVRLLVRTVFAWQYRRYVTRVRAAG